MTQLGRADVIAWVASMYGAPGAEERVAEGPAAFQVLLDDGYALLARKQTGEYWSFTGETNLYKARSDRRLCRALRKVVSTSTGRRA